jgi:spore coat polysaccharide biosynthesis protein SpsF
MIESRSKTVAIIQARMASSRLPDKVLLDIHGRPMLVWVVERTRRAKRVDQVVVATTDSAADDPVADCCERSGSPFYRGSESDVLDRYYQAAGRYGADVIVRITADCPLIDPDLIDDTLEVFTNEGLDFATNRLPPPWGRTYPIGMDTEVFSYAALDRAWKETDQSYQREHVTPYFYEDAPPEHLHYDETLRRSYRAADYWFQTATSPRSFKVALLHHLEDCGHHRWTVDTPQDLELVREIVFRFVDRDDFSWLDILALVRREPALAEINAQVTHKTHLDVDERFAKD